MSKDAVAWAQTILPIGSSVKQAVQALNETYLKIVLVTDATGVLVGTVSDGDIRRGLLRGLDLESLIDTIVHHEPLTVSLGLDHEKILQLMTSNKVQQIPIVDKQNRVIGLHIWDDILKPHQRANTMVIMAGGMGTRLKPHTENCPKPLLPIAGKPILEHIIARAKSEGFSNFVIAVHHLGYLIEDYFGDGEKLGVNISYLRESSPLGTAGALSLLSPVPESPFIVTNGDVLTNIRYGDLLNFHLHQNKMATMAVRLHEWQNPYGVVLLQDLEVISYEEKPVTRSYINAGVYVFNREILGILDYSTQIDMSTLLQKVMAIGPQIAAYPIHEQWLDVGRPSDFIEAENSFTDFGIVRNS
jgi:dTDP-glucose pyrophosphorylase